LKNYSERSNWGLTKLPLRFPFCL